jgi:hypothetical protein
MEQTAFSGLEHKGETEAELVKEQRTHVAAQPAVRFLADVLTALHAPPTSLRDARAFYGAFPPGLVLQALSQRFDLRVRLVRAITGGAPALLRRQSLADLANQIELLVSDDLPASERLVRAEEDRTATVAELYRKYLDATDLATYLPGSALWQYEGRDRWWTREASPSTRALMSAELKSIRRHGILADGALIDLIGDEALERDLPLSVRTALRAAARRAAREGRPFRDSDLFSAVGDEGHRDLVDELCDCVSLPVLRNVVERAAESLGWAAPEPSKDAAKVEVRTPAAPSKAEGKTPAPLARPAAVAPAAVRPAAVTSVAARPAAAQRAPAKTVEPAPAAVRQAPDRAPTPVDGLDEPFFLSDADVAFRNDHHPSFGDAPEADTVFTIEEVSR